MTIKKPSDPGADTHCAFLPSSAHILPSTLCVPQYATSLLASTKPKTVAEQKKKKNVPSKRESRNKWLTRGHAPRQPQHTRRGEFPLRQPPRGIWDAELLFLRSQLLSALSWSKPSALRAVRKQHSFTYRFQVRTEILYHLFICYHLLFILEMTGKARHTEDCGVQGEREITSGKRR